jgi:hypothetical protein
MKKIYLIMFIVVISGICYGIDILNRTQGQSWVQGGTSTTTGSTVIEAGSVTNIYRQIVVTATATGTQTSFTNTFATAFLATPTVVQGVKSGQNSGYGAASTVTPSTTTLIVTGLSTNLVSGTNSVPYIVYGTVRTGKLE